MTPLQLRPNTLDELIFEGRNKAYGAFDLRQNYPVHLRRALTIAVALFALMAGAPIAAKLLWPAPPAVLPKDLGSVELTPDPIFKPIEPTKPVEEIAAPKPDVKTPPTVAIPTKVKPDELVQDKPELLNPPVDPLIGSINDPGNGGTASPDGAVPTAGTGTGGTGTGTTTVPAKPEVFVYVEKMPEFEGGSEAMLKFLRKNMRYPALALRNQVEGKVFVSFTVSSTGDIVDVEVLKGLGYGTDEEALRVVKLMPRWQPGAQNGNPVAVRYTLPITFTVR